MMLHTLYRTSWGDVLTGLGLGGLSGLGVSSIVGTAQIDAGWFALATGVITAVCIAVPKIITALSRSKVEVDGSTSKHWQELMTAQRLAHEAESKERLARHAEALAHERGMRDQATIVAQVLRRSKHRAMNAYDVLANVVRELEVNLPKEQRTKILTYDEIVGAEDKIILDRLTKDFVWDSPL